MMNDSISAFNGDDDTTETPWASEEFQAMLTNYAQVFSEDFTMPKGIPKGWLGLLQNAVETILQTNMPLKISGFNYANGALQARGSSRLQGLEMLNSILEMSKTTCPICGKMQLSDKKALRLDICTFCATCSQKLGFGPGHTMPSQQAFNAQSVRGNIW